MKLKTRSFIVFLMLSCVVLAQETFPVKITDLSSIEFPSKCEVNKIDSGTIYSLTNDNGLYIVVDKEISSIQSSKIEDNNLIEFYEGYIDGSLKATNSELISKKEIIVDGIMGVELEISVHQNPNYINRLRRVFYLKGHIITIEFLSTNDLNKFSKSTFFNSFKIKSNISNKNSTINSGENKIESNYNTAYNIGYFIAKIFPIILIFGVGILLFFLYKKKKSQSNSVEVVIEKKQVIEKIKCQKCEILNNHDSKFCKGCGFQL